ncbi:MAG: endonuclease domain-containing protein [Candidatus Zambryskibacteria bacterium]|nr:endonuclease domain-containing protein [Candidatus Zambryskibacteria bacterium]
MKVHNSKKLLERRKELRKFSTPEEEILWNELRNNKLGCRFRRQHSIGGYILDFYCFKARLIIELDSKSHDKQYDAIRDKYFKELGYQTARIKNQEIKNNLEKVIKHIKQTLSLRLGEGASSKSRSG